MAFPGSPGARGAPLLSVGAGAGESQPGKDVVSSCQVKLEPASPIFVTVTVCADGSEPPCMPEKDNEAGFKPILVLAESMLKLIGKSVPCCPTELAPFSTPSKFLQRT